MHGGIRQTVNGRTFCECPRNRVNTGPLCEAVRVSFENLPNPLTVSQNLALSFPLHISVEFISKDYRGTGGIFSLGDEVRSSILNCKFNKDQYTGYRLNASAPCVQPSLEWFVTGPVSINIQNNHGFTLILSLRTRQRNTAVLRSRDGMLRLDLENGTLELQVEASPLPLLGIDIADGMWHMIRLTVTPIIADMRSRMVELVVDGLWRTFYNASLLPAVSSSIAISDGVLIIEAVSSCLSDVRLEVRDSRNNIYHDYLINEYTEMRQGFLKRDCESEDLCALSNPCKPSEDCISEWQGFRCDCKPGYVRRLVPPAVAPACVLNSCTPNPCLNGGECFILENETLSWENETVAVLCGCSGGWTGLFCELPPLAKSGLQNWWLIPVFFVLILIVFWVVFCVCWFKRKKMKKKNVTSSVVSGPCFADQQERMTPNGVAKAGEEDYRGYLNLSALKLPEVAMRPGHLTVRGASIETRNADSMLSAEGERFLAMDQPLQYAFEGYDSSPPPTYFFNNGSSRPHGSSRYDYSKNTP
ncbi:unnamed protein product [Rodentolepis nana]|uniref:EGF-like domain-containing protein n=1 Tax=Rodentolepis nana TaxID=102285 RepID=A0A0R3TMN3_RODNA|nr:unnamed protein product [Rodentolepis nana]